MRHLHRLVFDLLFDVRDLSALIRPGRGSTMIACDHCKAPGRDYFFHRFSRTTALRAVHGVGSLPPSAGPEVTHRGVAVHDRDCARSGGDDFRAHDREGIVEGHHLAATYAPGGMHVIVAVRTPTFDEAVFPQLK